MPLSTGVSNKARQENVEREIAAGKEPKQAVAIAYAQQRKNRANDCSDQTISLLTKLRDVLARISEELL